MSEHGVHFYILRILSLADLIGILVAEIIAIKSYLDRPTY